MPRSLIIGATGGIGRAVTATLAARGDMVIPYGRNAAQGVVLPDDTRIDYLIFLQRDRSSEDQWQHEFNISLDLTKRIVEQMVSKHFGTGNDNAIVIVSALDARLVHEQVPIGYHMAKAALEQMARW